MLCFVYDKVIGVNPGRVGGLDPQDFGQRGSWGGRMGVAGGVVGAWTGRKILLYLIMYRKYVRKWLLLKRNRIFCPEIAVNGQFFALKIKFFELLEKIKIFGNLPANSIFFCKIA